MVDANVAAWQWIYAQGAAQNAYQPTAGSVLTDATV